MALFNLGEIEITPGTSETLAADGLEPDVFLARHQYGDWGDLGDVEKRMQEVAVQLGLQIVSLYDLGDEAQLVVSTAADRSITRMLLASEWQLREVSTQEGYAMWAASYDQEMNPLIAVEAPHVERLIAGLPIGMALDVGTGTGRYALKLARRGAKVAAIDPSSEMLAVARQAARAEGLNINFQYTSIDDGLPFNGEQFDFLICTLVLGHVPGLAEAIGEFHRVLRGGGHLLITAFHPAGIAKGWRTTFFGPGISYELPNMPHTRADYLDGMAAVGFASLNVLDIPVHEVPDGYLSDRFIENNRDTPFCLAILARK